MTKDITPDLDQACRFLDTIDPDVRWPETPWCFQTFLEKGNPNDGFQSWHVHGQISDIAPRLASVNSEMGGVFVTINETDGLGRKGDNIVRIRAVFADLDDAPLDPILNCGLTPHAIVESSAGRYQVFWRVSDCELDAFEAVQLAIAARFNSDKNVADKSRVMRLPGFYHRKHGGCFMSQLISCEPDLPSYSLQEIERGLGLDVRESRSARTYAQPVVSEELSAIQISDLRSALSCIPSDDRALWVKILHALKPYGDDGYELALEWSAKSEDKYDPDDFDRTWCSCNTTRSGFKVVFKEASDNYGWGNPRSFAASLAQEDFGQRTHARTEFGLAERFHDLYGSSVMYVQELGAWYTWDGFTWIKSRGAEIKHRAKETINRLLDEVVGADTLEERQALLKFASNSQKSSTADNVIKLAQSDLRLVVPLSNLDSASHLLGVANGAIDLRSGELLAPDPLLRITITSGVNYDKDAKAPVFEQTVNDAFFGDKTLVAFFQKLIGYVLLGDPKEDLLIIPYGCGSNGKSTILNAIRSALGSHAKMAGCETFLAKNDGGANAGAPREDLLRLRGARLVCVTEPDEGSELREGFIKSLTGGEAITARGLYASSIEMTPTFTAVMATNHLPFVKGSDHGIWRRLLPIPFTRNFSTDPNVVLDPSRGEKLEAETAGILAWCVRGAIDYQRDGLGPIPEDVAEARASYKKDMDVLADWIADCCNEGKEYSCSNPDIWRCWQAYAYENGSKNPLPSIRSLGRRLSGKGYQKIQDSHGITGRGWLGIAPREKTFI